MNSEPRRIVEYILSVDEEDLTCEACFEVLDSYVDTQLAGGNAAAQFPQVAQHLNRCPACWREYHDLYQLLLGSREGNLLSPPTQLRVDLSTILSPRGAGPNLWTQIEAEASQLAAEVTVRLEALQATFTSLPPILQPCYATADPATLRAPLPEEEGIEGREILALPDEEHNVMIRLGLGPVVNERGILTLEVEQLTTDAPIEQAKVTLAEADGSLLESTATNPKGVAIFRDLEIGQYRIGIQHNHEAWHLLVRIE